MPKPTAYFLIQIFAWLLFASVNFAYLSFFTSYRLNNLLNVLYISVSGFAISHGMHVYYRKSALMQKPTAVLIKKALLVLLLATLLWEAGIIFGHLFVLKIYSLETMNSRAVIYYYCYYLMALLFWTLVYFSCQGIRRRRTEEWQRLKLELDLKDAQLARLKSQINPHFLFNALNSIRALITENPQSAKEMLTKLSTILRYAVQSPDHATVTLAEELACVESYLALEQIRFEDRLRVTMAVDPQSYLFPMIPLAIQTLVENSIKHGIAKLPQGGHVELKCEMTDNRRLRVVIINSGVLEERGARGKGINNTLERLKLIFGEAVSFTIEQTSPGEVTTELLIAEKVAGKSGEKN